jgi:hypothetical protein
VTRRAGVGIALLVAASVLPACSRATKTGPAPDTDPAAGPVRGAIERVSAYFDRREVRGDEGWLVVHAAAALGSEFGAWATARVQLSPSVTAPADAGLRDVAGAEARFWGLRALPPRALPPLPTPPDAPGEPVTATLSDADVTRIVRLMTGALACTKLPASARDELLADARDPATSYLLTHQLLALMLAYDQGCLDAAAVDGSRRRLAEALWREQVADGARVHDLALERMAALCYAELCGWIAPPWIDAVVRAQDASGRWGDGDLHVNPGASATESHTAALGFYTLAAVWRHRFSAARPPRPPSRG